MDREWECLQRHTNDQGKYHMLDDEPQHVANLKNSAQQFFILSKEI